jgi:PAS domain S-box-containing protein
VIHRAFGEAASLQKAFAFECRIVNAATNHYEWFFIKGVPRYVENEFAGFIGTGVNIEEQKFSVSQLEYRKALLEAHNEASVDGILLVDTKGKILSYNHRFIEIWNMPKHITDANDDEAALAFAETQLVNPTQFMEKVKWLYDHPDEISIDELEYKDGKIIERHGYPVTAPDGSYYAWSWIFRDITEQKKAEKTIRESEERYHQLIISSPSAIGILKGPHFVITTANEAILKVWGKGRAIVGKPYFEVLPELAAQGYREIFNKVYATGEPFNATETPVNILQDGTMQLKYYNFLLYPQRSINNEIDGIGIIATEVTTQALVNKKIKESEKQFRQMAELMPAKISTADAQGNATYFNRSWLDYTGLSLEEMKGAAYEEIIHPDDRLVFQKLFEGASAEGKIIENEMRFINKDGDYKWHLNLSSPIKKENGEIEMWVGATTEIQKLKDEEKRKDDFLKMVSHELKTPVTSVKGYVQLLLSMLKSGGGTDLSALPLQSFLERIDKQILRLTRLITEMLDLGRLEESKLNLKNEIFSIKTLVAETVQDVLHTSDSHVINLSGNFDGNVTGDKDRIQQVLINFINNAIKYSPGKKAVEVELTAAPGNNAAVSVKDFGIGINKAEQDKIFERFYRVSGKNEETFAGFGIGLFIANEIIERHSGKIIVESTVGKGSVFTFILPLVPLEF